MARLILSQMRLRPTSVMPQAMHNSTKASGTLPQAIWRRQAGTNLSCMPAGEAPSAPSFHHRKPRHGPSMRADMQGRGGGGSLPSVR